MQRKFPGVGVRIGNPWEAGVLMGPLINEGAVERMTAALDAARAELKSDPLEEVTH